MTYRRAEGVLSDLDRPSTWTIDEETVEREAVTPNYEPPCIEERTPIGLPLVGAGSGPA